MRAIDDPDAPLVGELAAALECSEPLALEIVRRLRNGGISATTIRNTLIIPPRPERQ